MSGQAARTAIQKIAGTYNKTVLEILFATVESVDSSARTCDVKPLTGKADTVIESVALSIDKNDGDIKIPSVGSTVGVAIGTTDAFVFAWSDLDEIILKGGNFHGLVKVRDLAEKLNNIENDINTLKNAFTAWVVVPNDGGAALKAGATAWAGQVLTPTQQTEIENETITHGDK